MKGIVFTEFLDMVDDKFGIEITEHIVEQANLSSGGVYTAVGTYDHAEIVALVKNLSSATNVAMDTLIHTFGRHLLDRFVNLFPDFFSNVPDVVSFLENVDGYIHGEVRKLYPDATLPKLTTKRLVDGRFELIYKSERMLGDLAEGLIDGAIAQFGDTHSCLREDLPPEGEMQCVMFTLTPHQ